MWAVGKDNDGAIGVGWFANGSELTPVYTQFLGSEGDCPEPLTDVVHVATSNESGYASVPVSVPWNATPEQP